MINQLLQMTWYNPIFIMVAIGALWFMPGIVLRRLTEEKVKKLKIKAQERKIASLYPKEESKESQTK